MTTAILSGQAYVSIRTTEYPEGEIRGQMVPVPEINTSFLVASILGLGAVAARRKKLLRGGGF